MTRSNNASSPKSVHHVLGVTNKKALEIVEKLVGLGQIEVKKLQDTDDYREYEMVVLGASAS